MSGIPGVPIDLVNGNVIPREVFERELLPLIREAQAREAERPRVTVREDGALVVPMRGIRAKTIVSAAAQRCADNFCAFGPLGSESP